MFVSPAIHPRTHFSPSGQYREDWLVDALEVHLAVSPHVIGFRSDERSDEKLRGTCAPEGSVVRLAKLPDRILAVVAVPDGDMPSTQLRRSLVKKWGSRNLLVVDEGWLMRQPRRDVMQALAACKGRRVSRTDWILVEHHLLTNGGSSDLGVCAAHVLRTGIPSSRCSPSLPRDGCGSTLPRHSRPAASSTSPRAAFAVAAYWELEPWRPGNMKRRTAGRPVKSRQKCANRFTRTSIFTSGSGALLSSYSGSGAQGCSI